MILAAVALLVLALFYLWPQDRLTWHQESGYRWAELSVSKSNKPGFTLLAAAQTGIEFINSLTHEQMAANRFLLNGSGVAVGDIDGDGLVDIYFARLDGGNILYKNLGNWKFKDITDQAGVTCTNQFSSGAAFSDIDGDGDLDLLVTAMGGPNACFLNDGKGKFTDISQESGIVSNLGATTMALADIDGDGDLDLYIANYKTKTVQDLYPPHALAIDSTVQKIGDTYVVRPEFRQHYAVQVRGNRLERFEFAEPDALYLNDGNGRFVKVAKPQKVFFEENGEPAPPETDWGLTARFQDVDDDGDPDLYVCNDYESPDRLWLNDGAGRFYAAPKLAMRNHSASSMGVDFADFNRDGHVDFFLAEMLSREHKRRKTQMGPMSPTPIAIGQIDNQPQYMRNTLFLNRGDGTYAEIAQYSGVQASEWSWSPLFLDVDLDGYEDLLIVTGHYYDAMDSDTQLKLKTMSTGIYNQLQSEIFAYPRLETPNFIFRNQGDLTFKDVSKTWGFDTSDISHGMACGDFDNDGDLDVVINRLEAPAAVYRNEASAPRLAVRLRGLSPNTQGIGAKIKVIGGPVPQSKEVICGGSYVSASDPMYAFAVGAKYGDLSIEVTWRNGKRSVVKNAQPNRLYEIDESGAHIPVSTNHVAGRGPKTFFEDVSHLLNHTHHEDPYDDFARQPLLPNRLSQLGPGAAWYDLDGDGRDELIIAGGKGGKLALFAQGGNGGFKRSERFLMQARQDQTTVLGWTKRNGATALLVGYSNFEDGASGNASAQSYDFKTGQSLQSFGGDMESTGPLALADYDNDGDLDLFVGGRTIPGRYPQPASSRLYRNDNDSFTLDVANSARLEKIGLVTGAVFSDVDGDGDADLILAVEWGPITVLRNTHGTFADATAELGLAEYHGWWNGVTTGDLDEDGRLDLIATNWGLNSKYRASADHPLQIYYSDFDNNGTLDIVEAHFDSARQALVPERGFSSLSSAIPYIRQRLPTYNEFAGADLQEILGYRLTQANEVKANTLAHMVFFNSDNGFKAVALPAEAQLAPAFYAGVADFDGDGHDDVFLSQNFFSTQIETPRCDAGRGLWLAGDGKGNLQAIPGQVSGVKVYGEQRGAALGDYDRDGRVDLVVTQNGAATKLYHNVGAAPGLRVRLVGPKGNPFGVGATMRLVYENGFGPAREIHSGSGYWSQDAMAQILGRCEQPKGIWVRWPGGHISNFAVPDGAAEVMINFDDTAKFNLAHQ
ncbi:MAG: VCBS repeat-containing protein [candidate division KSB1 bacterium]|nr:VCBS repeat-containing protein [candidate division KSB1 bacterium]